MLFKFVEYNILLRTSDIAKVYCWISFQHMSVATVHIDLR